MANQIASLENRMREQGAFVPAKKSAPFKVEITRIGSDSKYAKQVLSDEGEVNEDGGPGSGNWHHAGNPGHVGGSAPTVSSKDTSNFGKPGTYKVFRSGEIFESHLGYLSFGLEKSQSYLYSKDKNMPIESYSVTVSNPKYVKGSDFNDMQDELCKEYAGRSFREGKTLEEKRAIASKMSKALSEKGYDSILLEETDELSGEKRYEVGVLNDSLSTIHHDGGPGSGNFGHAGRPGKVGGSGSASNAATVGSRAKPAITPEVAKTEIRSLLDRHTLGGDAQGDADYEIANHIARGDTIGRAMLEKSADEEKAWQEHCEEEKQFLEERYKQEMEDIEKAIKPGGYLENYTKEQLDDLGLLPEKKEYREPLFYRKGELGGAVMAFSTNENGANMSPVTQGESGAIGYDHAFSLAEMREMGYVPIAGIRKFDVGMQGESEVLFVSKKPTSEQLAKMEHGPVTVYSLGAEERKRAMAEESAVKSKSDERLNTMNAKMMQEMTSAKAEDYQAIAMKHSQSLQEELSKRNEALTKVGQKYNVTMGDNYVPFDIEKDPRFDGGSGSGNWGHAGVKGQRGGSAPGGGKSNRISLEGGGFSSAAKQRAAEKAAAKAAAGSGHTMVNGKDISLSYNGSPDINAVLKAQGFNGKPRVVQKAEFDAAVKASSFIAQRTYHASSQEVLDAYREHLYDGDFYVDCSGGHVYGKGMYCAADFNGELTSKIESVMTEYGAKLPHAYTETMTLDPSARIADFQDVSSRYHGFLSNGEREAIMTQHKESEFSRIGAESGHDAEVFVRWNCGDSDIEYSECAEAAKRLGNEKCKALSGEVNLILSGSIKKADDAAVEAKKNAGAIQQKYSDLGAYAAACGYDAVVSGNRKHSGVNTVVLNRTKLIILDGRSKKDAADSGTISFQYDTDGTLYAIRNGEVIGQIFTTDGSAAQKEDESLRKKADSSACAPLQIVIRRRPYFRSELADRFRSLMARNSLDIVGLGGTISSAPPNFDGGKGSGPPLGNQNAAGPHKGAGQSKGRFVSYKERRKIEARLKGQVSSQGTTVNHVSSHAFDRVGGRMISVGRIEKMLQSNNVSQDKDYANRKVYDIPGSRMVLSDDGTIVTVMWRKKNK